MGSERHEAVMKMEGVLPCPRGVRVVPVLGDAVEEGVGLEGGVESPQHLLLGGVRCRQGEGFGHVSRPFVRRIEPA